MLASWVYVCLMFICAVNLLRLCELNPSVLGESLWDLMYFSVLLLRWIVGDTSGKLFQDVASMFDLWGRHVEMLLGHGICGCNCLCWSGSWVGRR